jgi:hypothetical protein
MRSSIRGLMGAIPVMGIGLLAVRGATPPIHWLVAAATCLYGLVALFTASARRPWRFAWAAFAWGGSLDLALCFGPGIDLRYVDYLPSSAVLDRLFPVLFPEDYVYGRAYSEYCVCRDCLARVRDELQAVFLPAGHVVCALLAACFSGLVAWGWSSYSAAIARDRAGAAPNIAMQRTRSAGR